MNEKEQLWYTRFLEYADSGMSQRRWKAARITGVDSFPIVIGEYIMEDPSLYFLHLHPVGGKTVQ